jgi:subtilase family serine protease
MRRALRWRTGPQVAGGRGCACLAVSASRGHRGSPGKGGIRPILHLASGQAPAGYGPSDLQSAYSLPSSSAGSGQTVAVVDAQDDPNAESDLNTYRSQYGLPACTTSNGCFRKVNQNGGTTYPGPDSGWAEEESLDVDMVSAICPNCHVLLVEANSAGVSDLGAAVNEAVSLGAKYVSNSYGGSEDAPETGSDQF